MAAARIPGSLIPTRALPISARCASRPPREPFCTLLTPRPVRSSITAVMTLRLLFTSALCRWPTDASISARSTALSTALAFPVADLAMDMSIEFKHGGSLMRNVSVAAIVTLAFAGVAAPQARPLDWPSYGGDGRRTGWERSDTRITGDNVKDFQLVLKRKLEGSEGAPRSLTPPIAIGLLISYRGFKELGLVSSGAGDLWALDVDLNKIFWRRRFEGSSLKQSPSGPCSGVAVTPALTPPITFG